MIQTLKFQKIMALSLAILLAVLGRVFVHLPNVTPLTCISLLLAWHFSRTLACLAVLLALLLSDCLLGYMHGFPLFGTWSWFTYSGYMVMILLTSQRGGLTRRRAGVYLLAVTLGYWTWTNFGTWLTSGMYAHNAAGLWQCYLLALPFLRNALLGNFLWAVIVGGLYYLPMRIWLRNIQVN